MGYVNRRQIQAAREMDVLTYLQNYEPESLIPVGHGAYQLREHDSLKISNGKWCWWSHGCIGGWSALDFLIHVRNMPLNKAVEHILDCTNAQLYALADTQRSPRQFVLPAPYANHKRVFAYLRSRGIAPYLINYCMKRKLLYEDAKRHNAVFVDMMLKTMHAMLLCGVHCLSVVLCKRYGAVINSIVFACRSSTKMCRRFAFLRARLMRCPMCLFAYIVSWTGRKITCYHWAVCQSI